MKERTEMKSLILSILVFLSSCVPALAHEVINARILKNYDADTLTAEFSLPFNIYVVEKIRLDFIDTPEIRGKTPEEKALAIEARDFVSDLVKDKVVEVSIRKKGKYGRWLCEIFVDGKSLNQMLIDSGYAKPYDGGKREDWVFE